MATTGCDRYPVLTRSCSWVTVAVEAIHFPLVREATFYLALAVEVVFSGAVVVVPPLVARVALDKGAMVVRRSFCVVV